jgi:hypothetical protein
MLRLTHEIRCNDIGVRSVVGDHRNFRGTGKYVDADCPEQCSFRFGDA